MIKLQHYFARLIVTVFLLLALSLQAQTTQTPTTIHPAAVACDSLSGQTTGVQQRLNLYSSLVSGRQCVVLNANSTKDFAQLINRLPENTVILLSSEAVTNVTTPIPSVTPDPASGITQINYPIGSAIVLKDGQNILGAANDGFEIVIKNDAGYTDEQMVRVGNPYNFQFGETEDSHIRHVTFLPTGPKLPRPINVIVLAECFNRRLILGNNVFHLPYESAVNLECREHLNAAQNDSRPGPGLLFVNNTVTGNTVPTHIKDLTPERGIRIRLPAIKNQTQRVAAIENIFQSTMAGAGEIMLGAGTSMDVFRNTVNISNVGLTFKELAGQGKLIQGGFILIGHTSKIEEPPLYNFAGNQIRVTAAAIVVSDSIQLALACNHLQAGSPWQKPTNHSLKAVDPLTLADECERSANSTVGMATGSPPTLCQIVNTWTAINDSTVTALTGLSNVEGQFYFDSAACMADAQPSSSITNTTFTTSPVPTSSSGTAPVTNGLGVIVTLAILLKL
ncbi:hypothetical protein [Endozoicomonas sp. 8E]|uniref:hypothetical protein n=1 Tax=Endozoicomonas sp. 8E TaxID=3035692 RepID=UPI002939535F|nr:hypothetical protein [Endozoicomonas sp. 8E]WOG30069.1 hypothetical protein P6910_10560 [Endozoicomonas sp. 8E]